MPTPTNRPFLANFLAGFRAHSALSRPHPSSGSTSTSSSSPSSFNSLVTSQTRSLATAAASQAQKSTTTATTISSSTTNPTSNSTSTTTANVQANISHHSRPVAAGPNSTTAAAAVAARSPPTSTGNGFQHRVSPQQRRGSDSSSDGGFRDALGGEKWYIGGRTAGGEERFYRLGMVKKERSGDRLSLDRLSLWYFFPLLLLSDLITKRETVWGWGVCIHRFFLIWLRGSLDWEYGVRRSTPSTYFKRHTCCSCIHIPQKMGEKSESEILSAFLSWKQKVKDHIYQKKREKQ